MIAIPLYVINYAKDDVKFISFYEIVQLVRRWLDYTLRNFISQIHY